MTAVLLAIFIASLAGSLHCAGMCGALATVSCAGCPRAAVGAGAIACYHLSRGVAYALAGVAAGSVGAVLNLSGELVGIQRLAGILAGVAVILTGVALLMRYGGFASQARTPRWLSGALQSSHRAALRVRPWPRAMMIGALSVALPCGWLWAFLAVAAGMGSSLGGGLAMVAFWAGSVPILSAVGLGAGRLASMGRGSVAALMGVAMVVIGLHTVSVSVQRSERVALHGVEAIRAAHRMEHGADARQQPFSAARRSLDEATEEIPACCREVEGP